MVTILVTGSGTGVGKTRVTAALAGLAHRRGHTVQIVKPVQTGVPRGEPSDADTAAELAGLPPHFAHTLRIFRPALAPMAAAKQEGTHLAMQKIAQAVLALPKVDFRLIEGAGGIAVPLGPKNRDWADYAPTMQADALVLVVADELGAINQTRLAYDYTQRKCPGKLPVGIFLNARTTPPAEVAQSTRQALHQARIPLWGELAAHAMKLKLHTSPLARWLKA